MPTFHCPSCKAVIQAGEGYAGKVVVCPTCQQSATVPARDGAFTDLPQMPKPMPAAPDSPPVPSIARGPFFWLPPGMITVLVCVAIIATLFALLVPATRRVREAPARTQETNNLKNIGLAIHGFHDVNKRLPFNGSDVAVNGDAYSAAAKPGDFRSGSWAFQILPFIDQNPLFNPVGGQFKKEDIVACYISPGRGRPPIEQNAGAWCDYFINGYVNDPNQASNPAAPDFGRTLNGITDGSSNTILVGQGNISTLHYSQNANVTLCTNIFQGGTTGTMRSGNNGAKAPGGVTLERDSAKLPTIGSWGGPFPQGGMMAMGDATVRLFPYNTQNFSSFLTPTGEEQVILPDT
jgi:type II secretory pathway pseudopilin PulG